MDEFVRKGVLSSQTEQSAGGTAPVSAMAVAALVCGILAIPLSFFLIGVFFSGLAMTFAFLSRGGQKMNGIAVGGFCCAVISLFPFAVIFAVISAYAGYAGIALPYESLEYGLLPFFVSAGQAFLEHAADLAPLY